RITSISDQTWNRRQFYSVTRITGDRRTVLADQLACPPCNIGPASTPNYEDLAAEAVHSLPGGRTVFAGQRLRWFYGDLGWGFGLPDLRPFQQLHIYGMANAAGVNGVHGFSVHSIALKVPKSDLTRHGRAPTNPSSQDAVVGVWATASRQRSLVRDSGATTTQLGDW